jgi:hypothetical protein
MNEFRRRLLGQPKPEGSILRGKAPKAVSGRAADEESFAELTIPRTTSRAANHRDGDRHRLADEEALLLHEGESRAVRLVNLSGGGAMIEGADDLMLWDKVELQLGSLSRLEAVVRWIRNGRIGLEFAHETRIEADGDEVAETLRAVISRSFPDVVLAATKAAPADAPAAEAPSPAAETEAEAEEARDVAQREIRHPLIWTGLVHFNHDSTPIRLRNISSGGALVESSGAFPIGAELLLDLGEAGVVFCTVHWARGDQAGLKFHSPFDLKGLAKARPEIAGSRWIAPDYLREDRSSNSPWASQWDRSDLAEVHRRLELRRSKIRR